MKTSQRPVVKLAVTSVPGAGAVTRLHGAGLRSDTVLLFTVGFVYGLCVTLHQPIVAGGVEPLSIATSIVNSGTFADPFAKATGPTAHAAPVFPLYLAGLMRLFPNISYLSVALRLVSAACHGLLLAMLPLLSETLFGIAEIGFIGGFLSVVIPCFHIWPQWDCSLSGPTLALFCLFVARYDGQKAHNAVVLGLLGGILILLSPVLAIPASIWAVSSARLQRWPTRHAIIATAALVMACIPWTVRNYVVLGSFVPLRDDLGLELQVSNNDDAAPGMLANEVSLNTFHPMLNVIEAENVRAMGEVAYNRNKFHQALAWIASHPRRFFSLAAQRAFQFWFPPLTPIHYTAELGTRIMTCLSLPALILITQRHMPYRAALFWIMLLSPLPFYFIQVDLRYRTPLLWLSVLLAAYTLDTVFSACGHLIHRINPQAGKA